VIEDLLSGWAEMSAALPGYSDAERYYLGEVSEVFASEAVRRAISATSERYRFNLAATPVRAMCDRVELVSVTGDSDAVTELVADVWDSNEMDVYFPTLLEHVFVYGDAYLQVWPTEDGGVDLEIHNPKNCRVIYSREHSRVKEFAIKRWPVPGPDGETVWRVDLWYPDGMERWVSRPGQQPDRKEGWVPFLEGGEKPDSWVVDNQFGVIPFVHYRNGVPYGTPEHAGAYGAQNGITKMLSTLIDTTDSHGAPARYALTEKGAELDNNNNAPDWDDDTYADETVGGTAGGLSSQLRTGPGTIAMLGGMKSVGQFDSADPSVFIDPTQLFVRLMAQITRTPMHYFDPSGDVPSGESLKTADAPLVKRAKRAITVLTGAVVETWSMALAMLGTSGRVTAGWAPVESASGMDDWGVVEAKQRAGVPQSQTLIEAGYEADRVASWLDQEAEEMDLVRRVNLLDTMAEAITKLGAGVGAGVLDQAEASRIIATLIPQVAPTGDVDG
jgi:Phage portal protein, SPP1 Gp6-like